MCNYVNKGNNEISTFVKKTDPLTHCGTFYDSPVK